MLTSGALVAKQMRVSMVRSEVCVCICTCVHSTTTPANSKVTYKLNQDILEAGNYGAPLHSSREYHGKSDLSHVLSCPSKSEQASRSSADKDAKALKETEMKVLSNKVRRIVKHLGF